MRPSAARSARRLGEILDLIKTDILADRATDRRIVEARNTASRLSMLWPSEDDVQRIALELGAYCNGALEQRDETRRAERLADALDLHAPGITSDSSGNVAAGMDAEIADMQAEARARKMWRRLRRAFRWGRA